jgi:hypothetical protein
VTVEFGPVLDYGRVEDAILTVIRTWIDTYLVVVERERGFAPRSRLVRPRDWHVQDDLTTTPEQNLPVLYVVSSGETDDPDDDGEGGLSALLSLSAVVALKDTTRDTTRETVRMYSAALATLIDHKFGSAGLGVRLASRPRQLFDEALSQPVGARAYVFGLAYVTFTAQVDLVRYRHGGPDAPFPPPAGPKDPNAPANPQDPAHTSTNVTVTPVDDLTP